LGQSITANHHTDTAACGANQKAMLFLSASSAPMAGTFFLSDVGFVLHASVSHAFSSSSSAKIARFHCLVFVEVNNNNNNNNIAESLLLNFVTMTGFQTRR
jgi:hypothetical protein